MEHIHGLHNLKLGHFKEISHTDYKMEYTLKNHALHIQFSIREMIKNHTFLVEEKVGEKISSVRSVY